MCQLCQKLSQRRIFDGYTHTHTHTHAPTHMHAYTNVHARIHTPTHTHTHIHTHSCWYNVSITVQESRLAVNESVMGYTFVCPCSCVEECFLLPVSLRSMAATSSPSSLHPRALAAAQGLLRSQCRASEGTATATAQSLLLKRCL